MVLNATLGYLEVQNKKQHAYGPVQMEPCFEKKCKIRRPKLRYLLLTSHIELWLTIRSKRAPVFLAGRLSIIANCIGLVWLVEGFKPEKVNAPVKNAADSRLPVSFFVVGTGLSSTCIGSAVTWPASLCDLVKICCLVAL